MATQVGDKVMLETMIMSMEPIPWNTSREEFAVQVQVTAPAVIPTKQSESDSESSEGVGSGVDLVAVLDMSGGMNEDGRLERMKEAMISVMGQLCPDDRLCVLSFNDEVRPLTELCPMSDENWASAASKVQELTAPAGGGANVKAATDAAAAILAQRGEEEQSNRVGRVIFLSGGGGGDDEDAGTGDENTDTSGPELSADDPASPEVAPGAFVLGGDDSLSALSFGSNNASGAYTCVNEDIDKIKDGAADLVSVDTAMGVQIDVHPQEGVAISSIGSGTGSKRVRVGPDGPRSLTIYIKDLHAGEQKSFTVYLKVPEAKEELLAVTGWYSDPESGEDVQLGVSEVFVLRPKELSHKVRMMGERAATSWALPFLQLQRVRIMGEKAMAWARNPYSYSWALPCVAFLLLAATLYVGIPATGRTNGSLADGKTEEAGSRKSDLLLDHHPGLPSMEEALQATMLLRKMRDDTGIASILHGAPVEDMTRAMNTYIYQALVHTVGPAQHDVCPAARESHVSLLEQTVQMLESELRVKMETLGEEKREEVAADCAPGKEKHLALELAKARIQKLEQQLQDQ